jgi:hypothetical protein
MQAMSVPVLLGELAERIEEYGPSAHLVTVNDNGTPHVTSANVGWEGDELRVGAGKRTGGNAASRPGLTLLWAARPGQDYSLIVDGEARVVDGGDALLVRPGRAVLHRVANADASLPSCVTVLDT